ncbi:MAG: hypothetical protein ACR5LC_08020 [Symbiopectobacterium sp.]|uniref:hypothetical protein n=1 Tax=Symbiopectobacterium sp. TaxID=2952789 RepID=UPI003F3CAFCF
MADVEVAIGVWFPWRKSLMLGVVMLWVAAAAEVAGPALVSYFIDNLVANQVAAGGGGR